MISLLFFVELFSTLIVHESQMYIKSSRKNRQTMEPSLRSRYKFFSDQTFQTEIDSDAIVQTEITPDQIFQTKKILWSDFPD